MKNKFLLLGLLTLAACAEDELANPSIPQDGGNGQQEVKGIVMTGVDYQFRGNASRSQVTLGENSVKFQWKVGDQVGIFPMASDDNSEIKNEGVQVTFPMADGAGTNKAFFDGGGWALKSGYKYASYFPLVDKLLGLDKKRIPVSYDNPVYREVPSEGNVTVDLGNSDFMTAEASAADASGNINFDFRHTGALIILNAKLAGNVYQQVKSIKLTGYDPATKEAVNFVVAGHVDLTQPMEQKNGMKYHKFVPEKTVSELVFNCTNAPFNPESFMRNEIPVYFTMAPQQLKDKMLVLTIDTKVHTGDQPRDVNHIFVTMDVEPGQGYVWNGNRNPSKSDFYVEEAGTLSRMMGPDYTETELCIEGRINEDDLNHIKGLQQLVSLDLRDADIVGANPNLWPAGILDNMSSLTSLWLPLHTSEIAPNAFLNFANAENCSLGMLNTIADAVQVAQDGRFSLAGATFKEVTVMEMVNIDDMYWAPFPCEDPFFVADAGAHKLTTKFDDMVYAGNISMTLGNGAALILTGKLSDRDSRALAAYRDKAITSLTFENVDKYVPGADVFVGFNGSEACDLVIPDAWKSRVSLVEGKLMMGGAAWKSVKDMNGKDIIAGVDPTPEIGPWSPGEGGDLETE